MTLTFGKGEHDRPLSEVPDALERWADIEELVRERDLVVLLDFDGTLAPIVDDPDDAVAPPATRDAIERLAGECTVAVVSGRDLRDVRERLDLDGLWYAGSHGFQLEGPDGEYHEQQVVGDILPALDDAEAAIRDELADEPGVLVERKRFAVAVHTRRADEVSTRHAADAVERARDRGSSLRVTRGREVTELRPDVNWDKGKAVRWLLDHLDDADGGRDAPSLPLYAGDDLTDEDALRAIQGDGIGVVVRSEEHGDRPTAAHVAVDGPDRMGDLLGRLAEATRPADPDH